MITRWVVIAVLVYVAYAGVVFAMQRRVLYPGVRLRPNATGSAAVHSGAEAVQLSTGSGQIEAWYVPAAAGSQNGAATVVFHGNAELAPDVLGALAGLGDLGVAALYVEYPGYGGSDGSPTEESILEAAAAGYDWLVEKPGVAPERVFAIGRSLGSAVAAGLSRRRPLAGMVLWSPFVSVGYMALRSFGLPPFLALDRYDSRGAVAVFAGPVLIFHGRQDQVIPVRHASVLAQAGANTELVLWDCGHNDCPPSWPELRDPLERFLKRHGLLDADG